MIWQITLTDRQIQLDGPMLNISDVKLILICRFYFVYVIEFLSCRSVILPKEAFIT
jgi:hypothetical protein